MKFPQRQANMQFHGRLTRDCDKKYDDQGRSTVGFSVAVERWNGKERVSWFANCRMFGKAAERFAQDAKKGAPVYVTGEPYIEDWETKDGEKKQSFKVFVDTASVLEWADEGERAPRQTARNTQPDNDEAPF